MPAARRTLVPLLAALAVVALVVGVVRLTRSGLAPTSAGGAGASRPVLHIGKPVPFGGPGAGSGRYVVTGRLPAGPSTAAVRLPGTSDVSDRVAALAAALDLGTPTRHGDQWRASRGAAVLVVSTGAGNPWTYSPGGDGCPLPTDPSRVACGAYPLPSNAPDVDPATARRQAEHVLAAADPQGCAPCRAVWDPVGTPQAQFETTPRVDGMPVLGYVSTAVVTAQGVLAANGWLGATRTGATYPLVSAREALDTLAAQPQPAIGCAAPRPGSQPSDLPLVCRGRIEVTGAQLGLILAWDSGRTPVLVPTWVFTVADSTERPQMTAVDPAYLADPAPATTRGGATVGSGSSGSVGGSVGTGSAGPAPSAGSGGSAGAGSAGSGGSPGPPESVTAAPEPKVS